MSHLSDFIQNLASGISAYIEDLCLFKKRNACRMRVSRQRNIQPPHISCSQLLRTWSIFCLSRPLPIACKHLHSAVVSATFFKGIQSTILLAAEREVIFIISSSVRHLLFLSSFQFKWIKSDDSNVLRHEMLPYKFITIYNSVFRELKLLKHNMFFQK